jgi:hypothetical protein
MVDFVKFMGCLGNKIVHGSNMIAKDIDNNLQAIKEVWIPFLFFCHRRSSTK